MGSTNPFLNPVYSPAYSSMFCFMAQEEYSLTKGQGIGLKLFSDTGSTMYTFSLNTLLSLFQP